MEKFFKLMNHNAAISLQARETEIGSGTESDMDDSVNTNMNMNMNTHLDNRNATDLFNSPPPPPLQSSFSYTSVVNTQAITTQGVNPNTNNSGTYVDISDEESSSPLIVLKKYVIAMKKRIEDVSRKCVRQEEFLRSTRKEVEESKTKVVSTEQQLQRSYHEKQVR